MLMNLISIVVVPRRPGKLLMNYEASANPVPKITLSLTEPGLRADG